MVRLARGLLKTAVEEFGTSGVLQRLADPFWFQSLACYLGFDWHSSGTTTTTAAALRIALSKESLGIAAAGGKGKAGLNTAQQLKQAGRPDLAHISRLVAKADTTLLQDGFGLYHHILFYDDSHWTVIQQGLNGQWARRYQWFDQHDIIQPERAVVADRIQNRVLNLSSSRSGDNRKAIVDLVKDRDYLRLPKHHGIKLSRRSRQILDQLQPERFEELFEGRGIGPATMRALSLGALLLYGEAPDWKDPALFAYAHGGKDGVPFPVDKKTYDETIAFFEENNFNLRRKLKAWTKSLRGDPSFTRLDTFMEE